MQALIFAPVFCPERRTQNASKIPRKTFLFHFLWLFFKANLLSFPISQGIYSFTSVISAINLMLALIPTEVLGP